LDTQSLTDIAQQHDVPRESLAALVRARVQQTREANGEPPIDQVALDRVLHGDDTSAGDPASDSAEAPPPAYTSSARVAPARQLSSGSISIYA
jgi:hypothetical protein